jgi:hypothetical protein
MALSHRRGRHRSFDLMFKLSYRSGTATDPVARNGGSMRARASPEQVVSRSSWVSLILRCIDLAKLISWIADICDRVVLLVGQAGTGILLSLHLPCAVHAD